MFTDKHSFVPAQAKLKIKTVLRSSLWKGHGMKDSLRGQQMVCIILEFRPVESAMNVLSK